jgi:hypothetical protein
MVERSEIRFVVFLAALAAAIGHPMAYESIYVPTPPGTIEVKTLPAARVLEATGERSGVSKQNGAFTTLFRYIGKNRLAMTVPVEADAEPSRMRFFVGAARTEALFSTAGVTVFARPARTVVSAGVRGSYSEAQFNEAVVKLRAWLADHREWRETGAPYAVYWNAPFVPRFLKKSEVHIALERRGPS